MSLRRRIALTMTALLAGGSLVFAAISLAVLDRTLLAVLDAKLTTLAAGVGQIVDVHHGALSVNAKDAQQIRLLHGPDEHITVLDRHGRLFYGEALPAVAQRSSYRFARTNRIDMTAGFGTIVAWQSDRWIADVRRASILTFVLVGLALVVIASFVSRILANALLNPLDSIALLAERIEARDLSARIGVRGPEELARLCASFDRMLDRLEASFQGERRFVADASHELRTPLAVVRAETDLALRRERTPEEYRCALESIGRETAQLESLVDALLGTMRETAVAGDEAVDLTELAGRLAARLRSSTHIRLTAPGDAVIVRGDTRAIERALSAVLHNAITHGMGGSVEVRIGAGAHVARIDVVDGGPGFDADALGHATERFWRGDSARSRGGTGLGLSVARVLVEAHGGTLRLANADGGGAIVSLLFPHLTRQAVQLGS